MKTTYFGDAILDPTRSPMTRDIWMTNCPFRFDHVLLIGPHAQGTLYVMLHRRAAWPINLKPETAHLHPGLIDGIEGDLAPQLWGPKWQN